MTIQLRPSTFRLRHATRRFFQQYIYFFSMRNIFEHSKIRKISMATKTITFFLIIIGNTSGYSKYGRTCKDIGCLSHEVCIMQEDPCNGYQSDSCGRYPTCKRSNNEGNIKNFMYISEKSSARTTESQLQSSNVNDDSNILNSRAINPSQGSHMSLNLEISKPSDLGSQGKPAGSNSAVTNYPNSGSISFKDTSYPIYPNYPPTAQGGNHPAQIPSYPYPENLPIFSQNRYSPQDTYSQNVYNPYNHPTPPMTTKKPSFFDKLTSEAKKVAKDFLQKTIIDEVSKSFNKQS